MSELSNEMKLEIILDLTKKNNITAYEIGKSTKLSTFAVQKILKGDTKNPNPKTLNIILEFLMDALEGTNYKEAKAVNEPKEDYKKLNEDQLKNYNDCLKKNLELTEEIIRLQKLLYKNKIEF